MPIGTGQRRQRNKVRYLNREQKALVNGMLLDGADYEDIREALRDEGVAEGALPLDQSFRAWCEGEDFLAARADWARLSSRVRRRSLVAQVIAGEDGLAGTLDVALMQVADRLLEAAADDDQDPLKLAGALAEVKRVVVQDTTKQLKDQLAQARAQLEAIRTDKSQATATNLQQIAETMDLILGGKK